ncbi:MAG: response regulator transcription factor [Prevotella sp.]|nr:response regulator transcription factor [Prevotella sp.]
MNIILADPQDITRAGMMYVLSNMDSMQFRQAEDKTEMLLQLDKNPDSAVVLDYTLFDINDVDEMQILCERFPQTRWIIFSFDLTSDFVRRLVAIGHQFSILLKDSPLREIRECLLFVSQRKRYICQRMTEILLAPAAPQEEDHHLTKTETEILKDIAMGQTTKEIAERRYSSFHTVNTHRKNIFRKLGVNNVHEATRYALRAGLIDTAEYYI